MISTRSLIATLRRRNGTHSRLYLVREATGMLKWICKNRRRRREVYAPCWDVASAEMLVANTKHELVELVDNGPFE